MAFRSFPPSVQGGKQIYEVVSVGMDLSTILILPFSAVVAFAALVGAAIAKFPAPRLVWPWAISTLGAALVFLRVPEAPALGMWIFALFQVALSAAIGAVIGGMVARVVIAAVSRRSN